MCPWMNRQKKSENPSGGSSREGVGGEGEEDSRTCGMYSSWQMRIIGRKKKKQVFVRLEPTAWGHKNS